MKKIYLLYISCITALMGSIWYAFHTHILIISIPALAEYVVEKTDKKRIYLYVFQELQKIKEETDILWSFDVTQNISMVVTTWLNFMYEECYIERPIKVHALAINSSGSEVFISLSQSFFNKNDSIMKKWRIIEGLSATIKSLFPELMHMRLLIDGKPLNDDDIDCSTSLPLLSHVQVYQPSSIELSAKNRPITLIINPQGEKNKTEKIVLREFERIYTRKIAYQIKKNLALSNNYNVIITYDLGQTRDQEENATLANRTSADLYITISCFETKKMVPEITCYFPLHNPTTDFWHKKRDGAALISIHNAYLKSINQSLTLCTLLSRQLKKLTGNYISNNGYYGLPLTHYIGIEVPSMVIECGLKNIDQVDEVAQVIAQALDMIYQKP